MDVREYRQPGPVANLGQNLQSSIETRATVRDARGSVRLVVRGFEDQGYATAVCHVAEHDRGVDRVLGAFDHARAGDEDQRVPGANRKRPNLNWIHKPILPSAGQGLWPNSRRDPRISPYAAGVAVGRLNKARKQWMRPERFRLELRMKLHGHEPGVRRDLRDLDKLAVWRAAGDVHALLSKG